MGFLSDKKYDFETGVYRPPSEGGSFSLLVRFTRNCPWNHCTFCSMYKTEKFELRSLAEIKGDIDAMSAVRDDLSAFSRKLGFGGAINQDAALALIQKNPQLNHHQGFAMLYHWLLAGGKTAFLQDGNTPIMKTDQLVEALTYLRTTFPTIERVTSYARSKSLSQKSVEDLTAIRKAGLDRLHIGLESGDDELLKKVKKGVTGAGHVKAGQKALQAGFQVSEYWMPGLGGQALWQQHAENTALVLNQINPHYIRSRPFRTIPGSQMAIEAQQGTFKELSNRGQLEELRRMVDTLEVTSKVCFDHAGNHWRNRRGGLLFTHSYEGYQFPEQKQQVLDLIEDGLHAN